MFESIAIGIIITLTATLLIYIFRIRQLYAVIPRFFAVSNLLENSKLVEIRIFNKSRISEEDVILSIDTEIKCELVGATCESISLSNNKINIPRVSPGDDYSALLSIEKGDLTKEKILSITSKSAKGIVLSKMEDIPPNFGNIILFIILLIALLTIPITGLDYYEDYKKEKAINSLNGLVEKKWSEYDRYATSDFRKNYSDGEFPIYLSDIKRENNNLLITFRLINKSASEMEVSKTLDWPYKDLDPKPWENISIYHKVIKPLDAENLLIPVYWPKGNKGKLIVKFNISVGNDSYLGATKTIEIEEKGAGTIK
jgi:hypothetical protein